MASWITHIMVADNVLNRGLNLDKQGFCVGNIAPDCNVESEDWKEFIPPREVTHWMKGNSKLSADYEEFYDRYIHNQTFSSHEHHSFLLGYYTHLITDVEFQKFIREPERVQNIFNRIKSNEALREKIIGYPEDFDTLKKVFGRNHMKFDIDVQEWNYLNLNPSSGYNTVLRSIEDYPDYLDYLPQGAIMRKIRIMAIAPKDNIPSHEYIFYAKKEFEEFVTNTSNKVYALINDKLS